MVEPTPDASRRALKARWAFPVCAPPIPEGAVTIEGGRIVAVGKPPSGTPLIDLGSAALLPGLVNPHTHLEFSDLPRPLGCKGMNFVDWIREVRDRRGRGQADPAAAIRRGLEESLRRGTTTLADIVQPGTPLAAFQSRQLQAVVFLELIAPRPERLGQLLPALQGHLAPGALLPGMRPGLSPHAPYSVHPEVLARAIELSAAWRVPVAMHLAESADEMELLGSGRGRFREFLLSLESRPGTPLYPLLSPRGYLERLSEAHRALVIHGNYLDDQDLGLLASHARHMSLVYCPRTHEYFGHAPYPLEKALSAGVRVAVGTDSRASSPDLDMLAELRLVAKRHPSVPLPDVLKMGTLFAAEALGLDAEAGTLEPGKRADLAVVALPDGDDQDPHRLLLQSDQPVIATCLGGAVCQGAEQAPGGGSGLPRACGAAGLGNPGGLDRSSAGG
ncbi:MAG: amidohydrolase family protein [Thermoguttaceae bacterium]